MKLGIFAWALTVALLPGLAWSQELATEIDSPNLDAREAALAEREAELTEREEEVAAREAELAAPAEAEAEEPGPWSGEIALGYLSSAGNTDTSSGTARVKIVYTINDWEHFVEGKGYGSSDDEGTTAEAYEVVGKSTWNLTELSYLYGAIEWQKNRFSAYTQQTFETVGYGRHFIKNDTVELTGQIGVGLTQQKQVVQEDPQIIEDQDNAVYTAGAGFLWNLSETSTFEQLAQARAASDNTAWETITRVKVNMLETLALAVSYNIQGNTDVEGDLEKTDRYTSITLDYSF